MREGQDPKHKGRRRALTNVIHVGYKGCHPMVAQAAGVDGVWDEVMAQRVHLHQRCHTCVYERVKCCAVTPDRACHERRKAAAAPSIPSGRQLIATSDVLRAAISLLLSRP